MTYIETMTKLAALVADSIENAPEEIHDGTETGSVITDFVCDQWRDDLDNTLLCEQGDSEVLWQLVHHMILAAAVTP
jgi:hypothetical protein